MKKLLLIAVLNLAAASMVFAQGQINFDNRASVIGHAALVTSQQSGLGLAGADGWVANLYDAANPSAGAIVVEGPALFRNTATTLGTFAGAVRNFVNSVANGQTLSLIIRVWNTNLGDFAANQAVGVGGASSPFSYTVPAVGAPPGQLVMANLQGFSVNTVPVTVPEPSVIALGVIGVGALLLRRRK
jgi:hypothetical protein